MICTNPLFHLESPAAVPELVLSLCEHANLLLKITRPPSSPVLVSEATFFKHGIDRNRSDMLAVLTNTRALRTLQGMQVAWHSLM